VLVQVANEIRTVFPIGIGQPRFHAVSIRPLRRSVEVTRLLVENNVLV
jgi:hypothetical protein